MDSTKSAFMMALDLELQRCGWTERVRHYESAIEAVRRDDCEAFRKHMDAFHAVEGK
jgi:hypothetical protein